MVPESIAAVSEQAVAETVAAASAAGRTLEIAGGGSKAALGHPVRADARLEITGLSGIVDYEPAELVLTAWAGTPLAEIEAALTAAGQALAFEPRDLSGLLGTSATPTLGGVVATNPAGPRRCVAGSARDHVLGVHAVNGLGELFKAGGKVVKNVTGYDLCKVLTGSFGTLAVLTEITLKVLPAAETEETLVVPDLDATAAVGLMNLALGSPASVSAVAWLPAELAADLGPTVELGGRSATLLRLEGFAPSVAARHRGLLDRLAARRGDAIALPAEASRALWRRLGDVQPFHAPAAAGAAVWKLQHKPTDAPALLERLARLDGTQAFLDWGGALAWVATPCGGDGGAGAIRAAVPPGGHATLIAAPETVRSTQAVFQPSPPALAALEARLKASFDPKGILNPGRMAATV
jgi:glycolate oxidase FAD binding subunit